MDILNIVPKNLEANSLQYVTRSIYAIFGLQLWNNLHVIDITSLIPIRKLEGKSGLISYFDYDPSEAKIAVSNGNHIDVMNYDTGKDLFGFDASFYISNIQAVSGSEHLMIINIEFVRVYDTKDNSGNLVYSYKLPGSVYTLANG